MFATREPASCGLKDPGSAHRVRGLAAGHDQPRAGGAGPCVSPPPRLRDPPRDVRSIGLDVLRHRVLLTYEAEAEEVSADEVVNRVLGKVEVP